MNYKQIKDLSNKSGTWFEVLEDYIYASEFATEIIPKGTRMQFKHRSLAGWRFYFDEVLPGFLGIECGFGRSRLLKLKLREMSESEL